MLNFDTLRIKAGQAGQSMVDLRAGLLSCTAQCSTHLQTDVSMPELIQAEITDILSLCHLVCEKLGRGTVATELQCSTQAIGKALKVYDDPYKYRELRLLIVGLCFTIEAGPIYNITVPEDVALELWRKDN